MRQSLILTAFCAVFLVGARAAEAVDVGQRNRAATAAYYTRLVQGESPRLAELTLFATLLPKGGDVHHHYSGALYAETYLDWVAERNYCIYRPSASTPKAKNYRIEVDPAALGEAARAECLSVAQLRADNDVYRELLKRWSNKDFDNHVHLQPAPDQQFFDTFGYFGPISGHDTKRGLAQLKARALDENVGYLETMLSSAPAHVTPELESVFAGLDLGFDARPETIAAVLARAFAVLDEDAVLRERIVAYAQRHDALAEGVDDVAFRLRFLTYVTRNNPLAQVFSGLFAAFSAAARSPAIVGVNIVGPENGHVAMRDYRLHMHMFAFLREHFPGVRLSLHAGELALGMVPPEGLRSHVSEAVLVAGAQRIGHGVDIAHERDALELLALMRQQRVAVEVNLTSNAFILGVANEAHPVRLYARHGVPIILSTDDPGVSRNTLSSEYLLYASRYQPSYEELRAIAYNSIRYAFLSEADKRDELRRLDARFTEFESRMAALARHEPGVRGGRPVAPRARR